MTVSEPNPAPDRSAERSATGDLSLHVAEERFIEAMGLAHEEDRLPRIAGRLIGLLILSPDPVRFDHLAERLRVSRASISTNTRLLENIADRYRTRQASAEEMKQALMPNAGGEVVVERLERLIRFYAILADSLQYVLGAAAEGEGNSGAGRA